MEGCNLRDLDVAIAREVLGKEVEYVDTLEGWRWKSRPEYGIAGSSADVGGDRDMEPLIASVPVIKRHGIISYEHFNPWREWSSDQDTYVLDVVPRYSSDFNAAWVDIAQKLVCDGYNVVVGIRPTGDGCVEATVSIFSPPRFERVVIEDDPALALVKAALQVVRDRS